MGRQLTLFEINKPWSKCAGGSVPKKVGSQTVYKTNKHPQKGKVSPMQTGVYVVMARGVPDDPASLMIEMGKCKFYQEKEPTNSQREFYNTIMGVVDSLKFNYKPRVIGGAGRGSGDWILFGPVESYSYEVIVFSGGWKKILDGAARSLGTPPKKHVVDVCPTIKHGKPIPRRCAPKLL